MDFRRLGPERGRPQLFGLAVVWIKGMTLEQVIRQINAAVI
jgi:hypothetical protein